MKFRITLFLLMFVTACAPASVKPTAQAVDSPTAAASAAPNPADGTTLYISATMHIESKSDSWPQDVEAFLAFLQQTTDAGVRWSIGGDIGWLEGDSRAKEIVTRAASLGVQWDVHAHKDSDRAKVAATLAAWGVTPTSVISGMLIEEYDGIGETYTYQGYTWTPQVVWGGARCAGHRPGCDDFSVTIYRPASSAQYDVHDPKGHLIRVGSGDHHLDSAEALAAQIVARDVDAPVVGFTLMVEPETLRIVGSNDDLNAILAFVARMNAYPFVRWGTIEATAQAWVNAGTVPFLIGGAQ